MESTTKLLFCAALLLSVVDYSAGEEYMFDVSNHVRMSIDTNPSKDMLFRV